MLLDTGTPDEIDRWRVSIHGLTSNFVRLTMTGISLLGGLL